MSTPASALSAFLLGMAVMVLLVATGVFDHTIGRFLPRRPAEIIAPYGDAVAPLLVSAGPADGSQDARCPPVFDISNNTSRMIYFQNGAPADENTGSDAHRYQRRDTASSDQAYDDRHYGNPYGARDYGSYNDAPPDRGADTGQRMVVPGGKIKIRTGYGGRHDCPRSIVKVWLTDGP
jgi:hypothetical protein